MPSPSSAEGKGHAWLLRRCWDSKLGLRVDAANALKHRAISPVYYNKCTRCKTWLVSEKLSVGQSRKEVWCGGTGKT